MTSHLPRGQPGFVDRRVKENDNAAHTVWVTSTNGAVSVIDEASGQVVRAIPTGNGPNKVAVDPAAHIAYVTNAYWYRVQVIDQATNSVAATIPHVPP